MVGPWGWHGAMRGPGLLGGGLFALVACLLFLLVAALIVWLFVRAMRGGRGGAILAAPPSAAQSPTVPPNPVLETLRRRLAEGAITPEEFDQLREKLGV